MALNVHKTDTEKEGGCRQMLTADKGGRGGWRNADNG